MKLKARKRKTTWIDLLAMLATANARREAGMRAKAMNHAAIWHQVTVEAARRFGGLKVEELEAHELVIIQAECYRMNENIGEMSAIRHALRLIAELIAFRKAADYPLHREEASAFLTQFQRGDI